MGIETAALGQGVLLAPWPLVRPPVATGRHAIVRPLPGRNGCHLVCREVDRDLPPLRAFRGWLWRRTAPLRRARLAGAF